MNIMTFILTVTMIWIILLFMSFSIGIKMPEKTGKGHAKSAPEKHYMPLKILTTFLLSVVIAILYWYIMYKM